MTHTVDTLTCEWCGEAIQRTDSPMWRLQKYDTRRCRDRAYAARKFGATPKLDLPGTKTCEWCGKTFQRRPGTHDATWQAQRFDSKKCRDAAWSAANRRTEPQPTAEPVEAQEQTTTAEVRVLVRRNWRDEAVCRGHDPEVWFPTGTTGPAVAQIAKAKAVCEGCPVSWDCLTWALHSGTDYGVFGGATAEERREMKARLAS